MKYTDLIDPEYLIPPESEMSKEYTITRYFDDTSYFIHFRPWKILSRSYRDIDTNWKARLSIHPEDMNKAWEIILPYLYRRDISFKVANLNAIEKFKNNRQRRLDKLVEEYNQFVQNSHFPDINFLRNTFQKRYQQLGEYSSSKWRLISFIQMYLTKLSGFFYQYTLK